MSMIEVKTAELIGPALDWAVAETEGIQRFSMGNDWPGNSVVADAAYRDRVLICNLLGRLVVERGGWSNEWSPSTDWAQGGPLIEKYQVATIPEAHDGQAGTECSEKWYAVIYYDGGEQYTAERCDSPLIAACRAIVAANLGDVVSVPEELVQQQEERGKR